MQVLENGLALAVIAGLAVGTAFVFLFAFEAPRSTSPSHQVQDNNITKVEFPTKYNWTQIPDLHMIVKTNGKIYAGDEGSYCWDSVCADTIRIVPENTIVLNKGTEIEFKIQNYRMPETLNVNLNLEPLPVPNCTENYDNATHTYSQTCDSPPEIPPLTKLDSFTYRVDLPIGTYTIGASAYWKTTGSHEGSDAIYFYLIQVK